MGKLRTLLLAGAALLLLAPGARAEMKEFVIDPDHSSVNFKVDHMFSRTAGQFKEFSGTLILDPDAETIGSARGVVQTASVDTRHEKRDGHLKSEDFFNVEKHPTMTFVGKKFKGSGKKIKIQGNFTLLGTTRRVTFDAVYHGIGADPWGNTRTGITATTTINRKDYGMDFNKVLDTGGLLIGNDVDITLEIEAILKKQGG